MSWQHIEELWKIQEKEGLRLGNKVKKAHIDWRSQPVKVSLAVQVLSESTATSLEYLNKVLQLEKFKGCEATVDFLRRMNHLFDILNSRNPVVKGKKAAMRLSNKEDWEPFLREAEAYILGLTDVEGRRMVSFC